MYDFFSVKDYADWKIGKCSCGMQRMCKMCNEKFPFAELGFEFRLVWPIDVQHRKSPDKKKKKIYKTKTMNKSFQTISEAEQENEGK